MLEEEEKSYISTYRTSLPVVVLNQAVAVPYCLDYAFGSWNCVTTRTNQLQKCERATSPPWIKKKKKKKKRPLNG